MTKVERAWQRYVDDLEGLMRNVICEKKNVPARLFRMAKRLNRCEELRAALRGAEKRGKKP